VGRTAPPHYTESGVPIGRQDLPTKRGRPGIDWSTKVFIFCSVLPRIIEYAFRGRRKTFSSR